MKVKIIRRDDKDLCSVVIGGKKFTGVTIGLITEISSSLGIIKREIREITSLSGWLRSISLTIGENQEKFKALVFTTKRTDQEIINIITDIVTRLKDLKARSTGIEKITEYEV